MKLDRISIRCDRGESVGLRSPYIRRDHGLQKDKWIMSVYVHGPAFFFSFSFALRRSTSSRQVLSRS